MRRRHTLRHPIRGDRRYARPVHGGRPPRPSRTRSGLRLSRLNGPRMRPRRKVNVASLVTTAPEELPSRPGVRLYVIGTIVLVLFAVMVLRLWTLQVIDHKTYAAAVTANQVRMVTVPAPRGLIVDRNGTVLVNNQVQNELLLSRAEASEHPAIIAQLAAAIGKPAATIRAAITNVQYSPYQPVPILDPATAAVVQYVEAHKSEFPGVTVTQVTQRAYPQGGTVAAQVLGYVGPITSAELKTDPGYSQSSQVGQSGLEAEYQKYLQGAHGREALAVNATGTEVGTLSTHRPSQGDTVETNLTLGLQKAVQQDLAADITADRHRDTPTTGVPAAPDGAAVVMNVKTGAVLALASYPSYSLNTWIGGISTPAYDALTADCTKPTGSCPLLDYATQGLYTPGSTFKLATASAALQDGLITPSSYIDDTGTFSMKTHGYPTCTSGCNFHDATHADAGAYDVSSALTVSDDYFFYTLGVRFYATSARYGPDAIAKTANALGFGTSTGIDLPDETQGRVDSKTLRIQQHEKDPAAYPTAPTWYPATALEAAFGQGETTLTPIEEAQAYATFADHGTKHQPEVAADILNPAGKPVTKIAPKVTGHVTYSPANWTAMLQGFLGATHTPRGTAYGTFHSVAKFTMTAYPIAGKTGTATTTTKTRKPPDSWFVGFGPVNAAPTQPEYVVAVAVQHAGYGATGAAPAVANIFNYLYANPVAMTATLPSASHQLTTIAPAANPPAGAPTTPTTAPAATTTAATKQGTTPAGPTARTAAASTSRGGGRTAPLSGARAPP